MHSMTVFSQLLSHTSYNGAYTELHFTNPVNTQSTFNEIEGSPYLNDVFLPASVNKSKTTFFIRFNAFENNIEYRGENDLVMTLVTSDDYKIKLLDGSKREYEMNYYKDEGEVVRNTFFEKVHIHAKFVLYLKENIDFRPVRLAKHSFEWHKPAKFIKTKDVFFVQGVTFESKNLTEIPKKEKLFFKLFGEFTQRVKKYIKKEKLEIDRKEDLIRIMEFYHNQLSL